MPLPFSASRGFRALERWTTGCLVLQRVLHTSEMLRSVTDEFWACVFLIPHEDVSRKTATVYPKDERWSGRVSVWYIAMTLVQNHMTFESLSQYFAEKKTTRPLNGYLLGTIVCSSCFPLGSRQGCFHSSEVSPALPFCKNLFLFFFSLNLEFLLQSFTGQCYCISPGTCVSQCWLQMV